jgi:hypothetical protein
MENARKVGRLILSDKKGFNDSIDINRFWVISGSGR